MSKQLNDAIANKVIDMTNKTTNNKINAAISIFIRINFRWRRYVSFVRLNAENT